MNEIRVTCVTKPNRNSAHEHITHLGGSGWIQKREDVIWAIDNNRNLYYTRDLYGNVAIVVVVRESGKLPYLRTKADGKLTDNLLHLTECSLYGA
ncbi:MAG TPA: DUF3892 domain-containing protein [Patescibacteria group bacterium]|jgi:hypothetical protein|nr:DUF3892 domain-containing protein [Patescibacteria group bacterium]